jgi:ubiquinone/menaquinone biosynthesis C-methylase UbiE
MEIEQQERWQISGNAAELYERYMVASMFEQLARQLLAHAPLAAGSRVLDVACGTGIVARLAAPRVAPGGTVTGVDLNAGMLAYARSAAQAAGLSIEWRQGDANDLRLPGSAFDLVFCQQGLQFFPDKAGALREMRRVLAPGGTIAIAVLGGPGPFIPLVAAGFERCGDAQLAKQCLAPYALADAQSLRALANEAGLHHARIRTESLTRRVEPTQQWLIRFSSGLPYGPAVAAMDPAARAEMVRVIAAGLKDYWDKDHFAVPQDNHLLYFTDSEETT